MAVFTAPSDIQLVVSAGRLYMRFLYPGGNAPTTSNHPTNPNIGNGIAYTGNVYARIAPVGSPPAFSAPFTSGWTNISTPVGGASAPFTRASDGTWIQSTLFMNILPTASEVLRQFFNTNPRIGQDQALYIALSHNLSVQDYSSGSLQNVTIVNAGRLPFKYIDWTDSSYSQSLNQSNLTVDWEFPLEGLFQPSYSSNATFPTNVPLPSGNQSYPVPSVSAPFGLPQLYYQLQYRNGSNWAASPGLSPTGELIPLNTASPTNFPTGEVPSRTFALPTATVTGGFQTRYRPVVLLGTNNNLYQYIPGDWVYSSTLTGDLTGPTLTINTPGTTATQGASITFSGTFSDTSGVASMSALVVPPTGSSFGPTVNFTPGTSGSWNSASSIALTQSGTYLFRITATDTQGNVSSLDRNVVVGAQESIQITSPVTPPTEYTTSPGNTTISGTYVGKVPNRIEIRITNLNTGIPQIITLNGASLPQIGNGGTFSTIVNFPTIAEYTVAAALIAEGPEIGNPPTSILEVHVVAAQGPGITVNVPTEGYVATQDFNASGTFPNPSAVVSAYMRRGTSTSTIPVGNSTWQITIPFSFLNNGINAITFGAVDDQGNESTIVRNVQKVYPPTVHITQPVDTDVTDDFTTVINNTFTVSGSWDTDATNPIASVVATRIYNSATTNIPGVTYDTGAGTFSVSLSVAEVGNHTINITVADNQGVSRTDSITVHATAQNNPPTISITTPGTGSTFNIQSGGTYNLEGNFGDDIGVTQVTATLHSPQSGGPQNAGSMLLIPGPGTSGIWRHPGNPLTIPAPGNYIWTFTAQDTLGAISSTQITLVASATNTPPTVTIGSPATSPFSHEALSPLTISGTFNDDAQVVTMAASIAGPSSTIYNPSVTFTPGPSGNWSLTFTPTEVGNHTVTISALDNQSAVGQASLVLNAIDTTGPVLSVAIPSESQVINDGFLAEGTVTDASNVVSITVTNNRLPGDETLLNNPSTNWQLNIPNTFLVEGSNTLTFVAEDAQGNLSQVVRTITYSSITANIPPNPTPVTATGTDTTEITIIWPVTAFADTWYIERREEPGGTPGAWVNLSTTLSANSYVDTGGLDPQGVYRYRVKALNTVDTEESAWIESNLVDLGETSGSGTGYGYVVLF